MRNFLVTIALSGLCFVTHKSYAQLDIALLLGERTSELELPLAFGSFLKAGVPVSEADEVSLEASVLTWEGAEAAYFSGKLGYLYTFNRSGNGFFVEPQAGYVFVGYDPWYDGYEGDGKFTGPIGTMNFGYRFGEGRIKSDLSLRYEHVFSNNNVAPISSIGLRFVVTLGFGRGKYYE